MDEIKKMHAIKQALIADDHSLYRHGLALLLKDQLGYHEVLEAASFETAVTSIDACPDLELALFDLAMPGMHGPGSLNQLRMRHPNVKIAIVAASEAKSDVLAAIAAGIPVIATHACGIAAGVTIVPESDVAALTAALKNVI